MDSRRAIKVGQAIARQLELPDSLHANAPYISFTSAHKSCRQHDIIADSSSLCSGVAELEKRVLISVFLY